MNSKGNKIITNKVISFLNIVRIKSVLLAALITVLSLSSFLISCSSLQAPKEEQTLEKGIEVEVEIKEGMSLTQIADLLAEKSPIDRGKIKWTEKNREVKDRHIEHTLMISNFRICLELALRNLPDVRLLFWQRENSQQLKDYVYIQDHPRTRIRVPIVPDGFFAIEDPQDEMYFFSEADQGTMTNTRFLKKMKAYWHWGMKEKGHTKRFGIKTFRVLTITKTEQRKNNLRQITKQADNRKTGSLMFWFTSEENYSIQKPESILKPIWQTPKDHKWHFILEE